MDVSEIKLEQIGEQLGIEDLKKKMKEGSVKVKDIIDGLYIKLVEKDELLSKCSGALTELREENEKLKESLYMDKGLHEDTIEHIQKILKDFTIKDKLSKGIIEEDQLVKSILVYMEKHPIDNYTKIVLKEIDYNLTEKDSYESIISKLVSELKNKERKIKEQQNKIDYMEVRLNDGQKAIQKIEEKYPGIFNIVDEQLVVDKGTLPFDSAVESLLERIEELENRENSHDSGRKITSE